MPLVSCRKTRAGANDTASPVPAPDANRWIDSAVPDCEGLPFSLKLLLENLLRHEDGESVTAESIQPAASGAGTGDAVSFAPARVFLHDTNGIPVLVDLAAMREAVGALGGDPTRATRSFLRN